MQIANTLVKANINVFVILVTMEMKSCVCRSTLAAPIMVAVLNAPPLASMRGQDRYIEFITGFNLHARGLFGYGIDMLVTH